jgi:hypothetical protein
MNLKDWEQEQVKALLDAGQPRRLSLRTTGSGAVIGIEGRNGRATELVNDPACKCLSARQA